MTIALRVFRQHSVLCALVPLFLFQGCTSLHTGSSSPLATAAAPNQLELYRPRFPDSSSSTIYADEVSQNVTVSFLYTPMNNGDTVGMRWKGVSQWDAPVQTVQNPGVPLLFRIPIADVSKDIGKTAVVTGSVGVNGNPLVISPPFNVSVVATRGNDGEKIANRLNSRYNSTENTCPSGLPAYYCNGIIIRSVDNGDFNPWDPSPSAIKLGAVSFSYFRIDSHVENFYRQAGFIFLPQSEAIAQNKGMDYLCIYAYDAGTIVGTRPAKGCGLKTSRASDADLSTCASKNATTVSSWYTFTKTISNRDYQCSLSTQDAAQFAVSYQVRANRPVNMEALWNELMVDLWPQNYASKLPIEAFFFKKGDNASRSDAKTFQKKFKSNSGRWVPVIALDLSKINGSPFSYDAGDQEVQP